MRSENLSPTIARSERGLWKLYLVDPEYGSLGYAGYAGYSDWPILEGRYTLCVLFEYAATLGLVDISYTDPAGARDDFSGNWGAECLDSLSRMTGCSPSGSTPWAHMYLASPIPIGPPMGQSGRSRCCAISTSCRSVRSPSLTGSCWTPTPSAPPTGSGH